MTRTGLSPRLGAHLPEPFVEIHPQDAAAIWLRQGDFARLISDHGSCILKVVVSDDQRRGSLFAPIHWSRSTSATCVGDLVTADTDPHSGQPEAKATPVAIEPAPFAFRGFILSRQPVELPPHTWWSKVALARGHGFLIASNEGPVSWQGMAPRIFGPEPAAEYLDAERGSYRIIRFNAGRIDACLFIGPAQSAPSWDGMRVLFEAPEPPRAERRVLLSGKTADGIADAGALVCACFGVGANAVREAIASGLAANVEEIGKALRAGTNCGSCLPELKRIVSDERAKAV
jgi:assimilatory nitrate reductase catalytic subunit